MVEKKEEKQKWSIALQVVNETQPPEKVIVNTETEETYDLYSFFAKIMEKIENIEKAILN